MAGRSVRQKTLLLLATDSNTDRLVSRSKEDVTVFDCIVLFVNPNVTLTHQIREKVYSVGSRYHLRLA